MHSKEVNTAGMSILQILDEYPGNLSQPSFWRVENAINRAQILCFHDPYVLGLCRVLKVLADVAASNEEAIHSVGLDSTSARERLKWHATLLVEWVPAPLNIACEDVQPPETPDPVARMLNKIKTGQPDGPFAPIKPAEIEDSDPLKLGTEGACNLALEVLVDTYPEVRPCRLTAEGVDDDFAHVFLSYYSIPLDITGFTSIEDLKRRYGAHRVSKAVSITDVQVNFAKLATWDSTERPRIRAHLRNYILSQFGKTFPRPFGDSL
jgi:hypothetical protein